jgi:hypothetical protein
MPIQWHQLTETQMAKSAPGQFCPNRCSARHSRTVPVSTLLPHHRREAPAELAETAAVTPDHALGVAPSLYRVGMTMPTTRGRTERPTAAMRTSSSPAAADVNSLPRSVPDAAAEGAPLGAALALRAALASRALPAGLAIPRSLLAYSRRRAAMSAPPRPIFGLNHRLPKPRSILVASPAGHGGV